MTEMAYWHQIHGSFVSKILVCPVMQVHPFMPGRSATETLFGQLGRQKEGPAEMNLRGLPFAFC